MTTPLETRSASASSPRLLCLLFGALLTACQETGASEAQCQAIFDQIVAIEITEMGFSDPVLTRQAQKSLRLRFRDTIAQCVGRPLSRDAMACVARAQSAEYISHRCLR